MCLIDGTHLSSQLASRACPACSPLTFTESDNITPSLLMKSQTPSVTKTRHPWIQRAVLSCITVLLQSVLVAQSLPPMLDLHGVGQDPTLIEYAKLPVLKGEHGLVTAGHKDERGMQAQIFDRADLNDPTKWNFRLHSYLAHFDGQYWAMWSHGRLVEDHPTQHLRYATSRDGLKWSEPQLLAGPPERDGFRFIARGLWVREGKLLALASHDEAYTKGRVHFFGPSLDLRAWEWQPQTREWKALGVIADGAINNFPPRLMPNGQWAMICRPPDYTRSVFLLSGGLASPSSWKRSPIVTETPADGFRPEEPDWWALPDGRLIGLFRDNNRSGRFYRAISTDNGLNWTAPEKTNFPDATSKFFCLRTSRGYYVIVSNTDPKGRNPLALSASDDGVTFTRMGRLPIPVTREGGDFDSRHASGSVQYPHVMEHKEHLYVTYSRNKTSIEVIRVSLDEVDRLRRGRL